MFGKRAALVALLAAGLVVGVIAVASGSAPSGFTSVQIARGQSGHFFAVVQFKGRDVVTAQNNIDAGGSTGWHSHPGLAVIALQAGQVTVYSEPVGGGRCNAHSYSAGQVFLERPNDEENAVNTGGVPEVAGVTFFNVPHGGSARIDRPDPGDCPG
jgi:quercetin dioxygenase-like cupin family protein